MGSIHMASTMRKLTGKRAEKFGALLRADFARRGWTVFGGEHNLTLVGFRSAERRADAFDDFLVAFCQEEGAPAVYICEATTDPGLDTLQRPTRADGTAVLGEGKHPGLWVPGTHRGRPALVSTGLTYGWRDANRDRFVDRSGPTYRNLAGIYLHGTRGRDGGRVGPFSAGCQVPAEQADAEAFVALVERQAVAGHGRSASYHLIYLPSAPEFAPLLEAS